MCPQTLSITIVHLRHFTEASSFLISENFSILTFRKSVDALDLYSWHYILNDLNNLNHGYKMIRDVRASKNMAFCDSV